MSTKSTLLCLIKAAPNNFQNADRAHTWQSGCPICPRQGLCQRWMVWSPKVASLGSGCREAENEKPIDRGQPALSACQSREGGRTGMVVEDLGGIKLFLLGNNILSNINHSSELNGRKGKSHLVNQIFSRLLTKTHLKSFWKSQRRQVKTI